MFLCLDFIVVSIQLGPRPQSKSIASISGSHAGATNSLCCRCVFWCDHLVPARVPPPGSIAAMTDSDAMRCSGESTSERATS